MFILKPLFMAQKTLKGKKNSNQSITTAENAEDRRKNCAIYLYLPRFPRFPWFISVLNTNTSLIQTRNLIYDKLWNHAPGF